MASSDDISLIFKVSGGTQFTIDVPKNLTIREVKERVSEPSKIPCTNQRLIYKGRILKDSDNLTDIKVESGHTMHLVRSGVQFDQNKSQTASNASEKDTLKRDPQASINGINSSNNIDNTTSNNNNSTSSIPTNFASLFNNVMNSSDLGSQSNNAMNFTQNNPINQFSGFGTANTNTNPNFGNIPDFSSLMNSPLFQQSMNELANNPQLVQNILRSNPIFNQLSANNPMFNQMINNPDMLRAMLNPQMIQTVLNSGGLNNPGFNGSPLSSMNSAFNPSQINNIFNDPGIASIMSGIANNGNLNGASNATANSIPSAQLYSSQLNQLRDMGFIDNDACLLALQETGGDINAAINKLLERGAGQ
ncbi:DSK2 like protein with a ubiquitin domain [Cryptosporidium ryanae]|uniref:DSK2 like protein with a ubiquitin domain n=1 Tax=Cryptosporidium ryanae TaxID=515981 RepID=UPI003519F49E|nr:DSK2 like protein with a ubiquitin domain [Cryptosporidium ryanae]